MWGSGGHFPGMYNDDAFGGFGGSAPAHNGAFTRKFRGFPVSFIERDDLERGDKIVLPPSALDHLARLNVAYPMVFEVESRSGSKTHCGVQEFIAEEGHANLPYWLMQNISANEGEMITIRNATLQKGTYVKLQPQSSAFIDIANPKAVLEATLRNFTCLTKGDTIAIPYNDKTFYINVLETAPGDAICIVEADVNVDFAPPADAPEEPAKPAAGASSASGSAATGSAWRPGAVGDGMDPAERLRARLEKFKKPGAGAANNDDSDSSDEEDTKPAEPKVVPFQGSGHTLSGRKGKSLTFGAPASASASSGTAASSSTTNENGAASSTTKQEEAKKKDKAFAAFSGKGRSLRD